MQGLKLESKYFPQAEHLEYQLNMVGAKGSVKLSSKRSESAVDLKCQVLASLVFPAKKLVDSELTTKLEINSETKELQLLRHVDNDFKSESRRQMEIKSHGIETRYTKFDEERGFIEIPEGVSEPHVVDPLSAAFLARDKRLLVDQQAIEINLLVRTGFLQIRMTPFEKRNTSVEGFSSERAQTRVRLEQLSDGKLKGPYLSPDMEVWIDTETGVVTEITYHFLGNLGRAKLYLAKRA